jgi:hypothetical protein
VSNMKPPPQPGEYIRHVGKLVRTEDVTPPRVTVTDYIFEQVSAKCELRLGDEVLKHIQTLSDWYGEGTGIATAIKEMKVHAIVRKLGPASELEVVVVRVVQQSRMRPNPVEWSREPFRSIDYGCLRDLPEPTETVVWSSKRPEEMQQ